MTEFRRYLDKDKELYFEELRFVFDSSARPFTAGTSDVHHAQFKTDSGDTLQVAVKRLRYTQGQDEKNKETDHLLEKEITALKRVQHNHVLPFVGLVRHNGDPCIVTSWIESGNLRTFLGKVPNADRAKILRQVASALKFLHAGGGLDNVTEIIHGDIHAGNVLIDKVGKALLADFGLCKIVPTDHVASLSRRVNGTPEGVIAYMAPEFHLAKDVLRSTKTDVFAFAILIFEAYTGVMPFKGYTNVGIANALLANKRPSRGEITRADFSNVMWDVTRRCWAGEPQDRPPMATVYSDLGGVA